MKNKNGYGMNSDNNKISQMTSDDRQILRDHAESLKKQGTPAAARELERMNKMYRNYGRSFGSFNVKGV